MPPARSARLGDLESRWQTMGFRGEALAAIASGVRPGAGQPHCRRRFNGDPRWMRAAANCSPPPARWAPRVEVRELFFSTPARRKFLKTDATELAHCAGSGAPPRAGAARGGLCGVARRPAASSNGAPAAPKPSACRDVLGEEFMASTAGNALAPARRRTAAARPRGPRPRRRAARTDHQYLSTSTAASCATGSLPTRLRSRL